MIDRTSAVIAGAVLIWMIAQSLLTHPAVDPQLGQPCGPGATWQASGLDPAVQTDLSCAP